MEIRYIVAIVFGIIFVVLFIGYLAACAKMRKSDAARRASIEKVYLSDAPVRMDYDFASYDEDTERLLAAMHKDEGQLTIDEVMTSVVPAVEDVVFAKMDKEEPEEITGNYKPE